jgi:RimJ/RimL family protein N-acetyltransferase
MIIAETERLLISKFSLEDAAFFLKLANTPHWLKYIGDRNLKTVKDAEAYLINGTIKSYADFGFGNYKLQLKQDNTIIGSCGLIKREQLKDVEVGFALLPEFEEKGFGYEASVAVIDEAKNKFHLKKLTAIILPINENSIKLIYKLGFTYEKRVKPFEDDQELLLFAKTL